MPNFAIFIEEEEDADLEFLDKYYTDAPGDEAVDEALDHAIIEYREKLAGRTLVVINTANMMTFDATYTRRRR